MAQGGRIVYPNDAYCKIFRYGKGALSRHKDEKSDGECMDYS